VISGFHLLQTDLKAETKPTFRMHIIAKRHEHVPHYSLAAI
jgi:hypothetical protein